jgi:DNA-binding HxlR family transcriptional regulator
MKRSDASPRISLPIDNALSVMGDKYTLGIVERLYQHNALRFLALEKGIPGISPRTLSMRLKALEEAGLIERHAYAEKPPKVEYNLTEKGIALAHATQPLNRWAQEWVMADTAVESITPVAAI